MSLWPVSDYIARDTIVGLLHRSARRASDAATRCGMRSSRCCDAREPPAIRSAGPASFSRASGPISTALADAQRPTPRNLKGSSSDAPYTCDDAVTDACDDAVTAALQARETVMAVSRRACENPRARRVGAARPGERQRATQPPQA